MPVQPARRVASPVAEARRVGPPRQPVWARLSHRQTGADASLPQLRLGRGHQVVDRPSTRRRESLP
jgi:hypothetical protein